MIDLVTFRSHALAGLVAFAGLYAPIAHAERVTDVRIGRHGEYTRVVIELDAPSGYKLERLEKPGEAPEILVKLDASSAPRDLASQSDVVKSVKLESKGEGSVARIALRTREIRLAEMKLSGPSRIVLDVRKASGAGELGEVASRFSAPTATPTPEAPKIAAQVPPAKAVKKPSLEVAKSAPATPSPLPPTVEAELEAVARGESVLDEEVEAVRGAPKKAPEAAAKAAPPAPPSGAIEPGVAEAPLGKPVAVAEAGPAEQAAAPPAEAPTARVPEAAEPAPAPASPTPATTPAPSEAPAMAESSPPARATAPQQPVSPPAVIEEGSGPTLWLGAALIAAGLFLAWRIFAGRRQAEEPGALAGIPPDAFDDRRATSEGAQLGMAERDDADLEDQHAASPESFAIRDEDSDAPRSQSSLFDDDDGEDADAKPDAEAPTLSRAVALDDDLPVVPGLASQAVTAPIPQPATPVAPVMPVPSVMPVAPASAAPVLATPEAAAAPGPRADDEVLRLVRELERRITGIEQRLVQTAESRERIERQIVAQTEELRVQRAAIARTQRVLRTLARPEDLATEPVPRGPSGSN